MNTVVVSFAGAIASGKTTLTVEVARLLNCKRVSFRDQVRAIALKRGKEPSRENLQAIGEQLVTYDIENFCRAVLKQGVWKPGRSLVVDGIRHKEVLDTLKMIVAPAKLVLVFIDVNQSTLRERIEDRALSNREIDDIRQHSTEVQVRNVLPLVADLTLDGHKSVDKLSKEVVDWLSMYSIRNNKI